MNRHLRISIVGAGTVGTTLALLFARRGYHIVSVISRNRRHANRLAKLVNAPVRSTSVKDIDPATDLILITTSDGSIRPVAESIARLSHLRFSALKVCHTSGVLSSEELLPLSRKGALSFSFHPIQTFSSGGSIADRMKAVRGISYGIEGGPAVLRFGKKLAKSVGGTALTVPKEKKILYHLICVFASNYTTVLVGVVESLTVRLGQKRGLKHFERLISTSVDNALKQTPGRALTGPIVRGSSEVIQRHLGWLAGNPEFRTLYQSLGVQALRLARRSKRLSESNARRMKKMIQQGR